MKNIHVLSTPNPSRLHEYDYLSPMGLSKEPLKWRLGRNIYITNDEEIKEGDYGLIGNEVLSYHQMHKKWGIPQGKKIILTTDELYIHNDLIPKEYNTFPQYIQKIDDEFLEWFVKNPSCEEVKTNKIFEEHGSFDISYYKIIIPKEDLSYTTKMGITVSDEMVRAVMIPKEYFGKDEPKQETLEEVAERLNFLGRELYALKLGAKLQQERSYSEEDMKLMFEFGYRKNNFTESTFKDALNYIKQKKK